LFTQSYDPGYILSRLILLTVGSLISAAAVVMFLLPSGIAPSGVSGLAVILNKVIQTPISLVIILANIPIQLLAFRVLNGWRTIAFTVYSILVYSFAIDLFQNVLVLESVTSDGFLNAVSGGVIGGIGGGLIYRAGGTVGGTSTIAQMLRQRTGMSLSTASLFGDSLIILLAGVVLGWEAALYALIAVFVNRLTSDYILEGPNNACTALIVTDEVTEVSEAIKSGLKHGVTTWRVGGSEWGRQHYMIAVAMLRSEVHALQHLMREADENAFVTILAGHVVFGKGFDSLYPQMPLRLDEIDR
jgi:uncharacterized membrane-anchored protein YitT (DUF2179 family)